MNAEAEKPRPSGRGAVTPAWHSEAKRMRASGMSIRTIAKTFGKARETVCDALDESGEHAKRRQSQKEKRARLAFDRANKAPGADSKIFGAGPDGGFIAAHRPRRIAQTINREAVTRILAERRGDIPLDELRIMLRGEA